MAADPGFLPVYLIVGADELKREYVMSRLTERMEKLGDLDFNRDSFEGGQIAAEELVTACNTLPFMSEKRLVVVRNAEKLRKQAQEAIISYLENPNDTVVLALVAEKLAKNTRLYKAIAKVDKKAVVDCSPKSARELPGQVRQFAASRGVSITQAAAEKLISLIGESTVHLDGEIGKMAVALGQGSVIDVAEVETYVARVIEPKPWHLTDALAARDARTCAVLLARMGSQSPFGLLTMCVNRIRDLLVAKEIRSHNQQELASALGRPDWQVKNYFRWADGFTQRELEAALIAAAACDQAMKTGADQQIAIERWILATCTR
jgi:DNA polymerase-3 subunit delta